MKESNIKKQILLDKNYKQLQEVVESLGIKKFRAKQIFEGLHKGFSISEISNLSKELRNKLTERYYDFPLELVKTQESKDGTIKFLFKLTDGNLIESVLMRYKYGNSVCVSSQVGCRMGCKFCASGIKGLQRNLTSGEILAQVLYINRYLQGDIQDKREVKNIVMMGAGEPLDNFENVTKFIDIVNNPEGINISQRNIAISTCGMVDKIKALADSGYSVTLTLSLHSAKDDIRQDIMPTAKANNVKQLLEACYYYFEKTGRRVSIEYILIEDITATRKQDLELIKLIKGKPFHVNLINLNKTIENGMQPASKESIDMFQNLLKTSNISVSLRRELGSDIDAACGQLKGKTEKGN